MKHYARSYYKSNSWKKTQAAYMISQHYICERCGNAAYLVHHRKYISPHNISDLAITLDWDNLEALCMECHNSEHGNGRSCAEGLEFDETGNLVKIS